MRLLLPLLALAAALAAKPRNVVILFSDDHALGAISAYGPSHLSGHARTPNVDRLAREGVLFRNCFVHNSICTPSRAGVLTGRLSHRNGV